MLHFSHPRCCCRWHCHNLGQARHPSLVFWRAPCMQDGDRDGRHHRGTGRERAVAQTGEIPCCSTPKRREDACCLNQEPPGSPDTRAKRATPKCLTSDTCEETSGVHGVYSSARLAVQTHVHCMRLYTFQQRSPNCSIFIIFGCVKFYATQKKSRDFVWVVVRLLLYKGSEQRLKEQNILLIHIDAKAGTVVLLLSS